MTTNAGILPDALSLLKERDRQVQVAKARREEEEGEEDREEEKTTNGIF